MHARFIVIGGGLSGLAAAIRLARYETDVLLIEKHSRVGGLNSYYYRDSFFFETGLHAITNYAEKSLKHAPFNKLLRQLKINRAEIGCHQQIQSEIKFPSQFLSFSNDISLLKNEINEKFKTESDNFSALIAHLRTTDPFSPAPYLSTRTVLESFFKDPLLIDMLLCPIMYYGSSWENDIDFNQFTILFRSIFQEGLFRPEGTIKTFLDLLVSRFEKYGGCVRLKTKAKRIVTSKNKVNAIQLEDDEEITCDHLISTIGLEETRELMDQVNINSSAKRLSFTENIFVLDTGARKTLPKDKTCIFYSLSDSFRFERPGTPVDFSSGTITLPFNFHGLSAAHDSIEIRTTHLANHSLWQELSTDRISYNQHKNKYSEQSYRQAVSLLNAPFNNLLFQDSFTPVTIQRYTGKHDGAVYGSPTKIHNGLIGYDNLYIAGTDQGYLGIVGSMLSGVAMVNKHILSKL